MCFCTKNCNKGVWKNVEREKGNEGFWGKLEDKLDWTWNMKPKKLACALASLTASKHYTSLSFLYIFLLKKINKFLKWILLGVIFNKVKNK